VHIDKLKREFFVRGAIIDLAVRALNENPDDRQAWSVIHWALKDVVELQEQLDGIDAGIKSTVDEIMPRLKTIVNCRR
jgi:hypothetical protein